MFYLLVFNLKSFFPLNTERNKISIGKFYAMNLQNLAGLLKSDELGWSLHR